MKDLHLHSRIQRAACAVLLAAASACTLAQSAQPAAAPAGKYQVDPYHSSLQFRINHLGLSNYVARFTRFDVSLDWKPDDPTASSVTMSVDPTSVRTDFSGDYAANHPGSPWKSFDEALGLDPKFFNAKAFPQASFKSTRVEPLGANRWRVLGELTLIGQTHPVELEAALVGTTAKHIASGAGALGMSATGRIKRSEFGMDFMVQPPVLGDEVTIQFEGEFRLSTP